MAHYFVVMEAQRKYTDEFITYLLNRQHVTQLPNFPGLVVQPNVREIRFFDISVFESCEAQLLTDLTPYSHGHSESKSRIRLLIELFRRTFGLSTVAKSDSKRAVNNPQWRDYINVEVIGKKKDKWVNGSELL